MKKIAWVVLLVMGVGASTGAFAQDNKVKRTQVVKTGKKQSFKPHGAAAVTVKQTPRSNAVISNTSKHSITRAKR